MKVLLVTKGLDLGGIERVVVDLATGFAHRDETASRGQQDGPGAAPVDVDVAVVNSTRDRLAHALDRAGVTLHRLDGSDMIGVGAARRLARLVRHGGYDIVHVHGPLPATVARLANIGGHGPTIVTTSHTPWPSLRLPTRIAWRLTAHLDDASIAVSSAVAASLPGAVRRRAVVIPHGIEPDRINVALHDAALHRAAPCSDGDTRPDTNSRPGSTTDADTDTDTDTDTATATATVTGTGAGTATAADTVTVVAVASHRDAKNYPNLLRAVQIALARRAALRLVTVGDGPNLAAHVALARSLGIEHAVRFEPASDDVLPLIARADLFAVASDYEGQPIVVAEALALGVPIVATAVGRVPEMVNPTVGRVVPPRDPDAFADALVELATDRVLRRQMAATARRQQHAWTLDDVIDAHLALYAEAASSHRADTSTSGETNAHGGSRQPGTSPQ